MPYHKSVGVLILHDIDHDLAPQNLKNLFTRIASIHSYDTRAAAAGKFHIIHRQNSRTIPSQGLECGTIKIKTIIQKTPKLNLTRLNCCSFQCMRGFMFIVYCS